MDRLKDEPRRRSKTAFNGSRSQTTTTTIPPKDRPFQSPEEVRNKCLREEGGLRQVLPVLLCIPSASLVLCVNPLLERKRGDRCLNMFKGGVCLKYPGTLGLCFVE